ncbi:MAG: hypothetical protein LBQ18_05430 [Campylobacteraceae bacterium]|jgi:hypothetical protein|nr:hypothetical protein [Campylobacteraceae bacterium]
MGALKIMGVKGFTLRVMFAIVCSFLFATNVYAAKATASANPNFDYDCNSLYFGMYESVAVDKATINPITGDISSISRMYTISGPTGLSATTTLALGPYGSPDGVLTMYHWYWGDIWSSTALRGLHPFYTQRNQASREAIYVATGTVNSATTAAQADVIPRPTSNAYRYWSGGEVNQKTGEIYFSGGEDATVAESSTGSCSSYYCAFRLMIFDPVTKTSRESGKLVAATSRDFTPGYVSSDMAIDADGNAYILVSNARGLTNTKDYWLVKVVPGASGSGWKYHRVKQISGLPASTRWYGMAFLNGKLYLGRDENHENLYIVDPLTGGGRKILDRVGYYIYDLATCQMAPVINGKVYYDENGDGQLSSAEKSANGIADVTVQVYSQTKGYLGEVLTSGSGEYSLMIPETSGTLYVRLKQPQINGSNAHQTWASGGRYEWSGSINRQGNNTVTPVCHTGIVKKNENTIKGVPYPGDTKYTYETSCSGARADGIDLSSNNINGANYYTTIEMETDRASIEANFALGPVDRSDAPHGVVSGRDYGFREAAHSMVGGVYLGDGVTADTFSMTNDITANTDKNDDGIKVKEKDNKSVPWSNLQNFIFTNNIAYTFNVTIQDNNTNGYLNAWISLKAGEFANVTTFNAKIADNINVSANKTCDDDVCYVLFDYMVPNVSSGIDLTSNKSKAYLRFRYSSVSVVSMDSYDKPREDSYWNTHPWAIDGEVEDYRVEYYYVRNPGLPAGDVIIVNENFNGKEGDSILPVKPSNDKLALYTQVANQPFNVKFVYHKDGKIAKLATVEDNASFVVSIVEVSDKYVNDYYKTDEFCEALNVTIEPDVWKGNLNSTSDAVFTLNGITTGNVSKRATFKVIFGYDEAGQNKTACSPDVFAIRPAEFVPKGLSSPLVGGKKNDGSIIAGDAKGITTVTYNQNASSLSYKDGNLTTPPSCNTTQINTTVDHTNFWVNNTDFRYGEAALSVQYDNVGNVNFTIIDSEWTQEDRISPTRNDCNVNRSEYTHDAAKKVGCDIASGRQAFRFIHDNFNATVKIQNAFAGGFTYLSYDQNMTADVTTHIAANLANNKTATNYHKGCFANDVRYEFGMTGDRDDLPGYGARDGIPKTRVKFFEKDNTASVTDNNSGDDGIGIFVVGEGNFTNGVANNVLFGFNFGHNISKGENPFNTSLSNYRVHDVTGISDVDVTNKTFATLEDGNLTFFYGRAFIDNYEGESAIDAHVRYELFCESSGCNRSDYGISLSDVNMGTSTFYLNKRHNSTDQGRINGYTSVGGGTNVGGVPAPVGGIDGITLTNNSGSTPYADTIYTRPNTWLVHDKSNPAATRFSFTVKFIGGPGEWAGKGESRAGNVTGGVINAIPGNKTKTKADW